MSDLDRNYASPFGRAAGRIDAATVDAGLRAYMLRIYNYMSIGLAITRSPGGSAACWWSAGRRLPSAPRWPTWSI